MTERDPATKDEMRCDANNSKTALVFPIDRNIEPLIKRLISKRNVNRFP